METYQVSLWFSRKRPGQPFGKTQGKLTLIQRFHPPSGLDLHELQSDGKNSCAGNGVSIHAPNEGSDAKFDHWRLE